MKKLSSLACGLVLCAVLSPGCGAGSAADGAATSYSSAAEVPIEVAGLAGLEQALAARRGHACLLNFWATWCPPCVAELPALLEVARAYEGRGARVLGFSFDLMSPGVEASAGLGRVRSFLVKRALPLPTLVCDPAEYAAVSARYELPGAVPVTLAFDRSGALVDRHVGEASRERFEEMLQKALGL